MAFIHLQKFNKLKYKLFSYIDVNYYKRENNICSKIQNFFLILGGDL